MSRAALRTSLVFACRFTETSGTTVTDWVNSKAGTLTGGTLNQAGPSGLIRSISFNGSTDYIKWTNATIGTLLDTGSGNASYGIWVKTSAAANQTGMFKRTNSVQQLDAFVLNSGGVRKFEADIAGTVSQAVIDGTIAADDGTWRLLGATIDRDAQLLRNFMNGVADGTVDITNTGNADSTGPFTVGGRLVGAGLDVLDSPFNGNLALPMVWVGRKITAAEWLELYNGGAGLDLGDFRSTDRASRSNILRLP